MKENICQILQIVRELPRQLNSSNIISDLWNNNCVIIFTYIQNHMCGWNILHGHIVYLNNIVYFYNVLAVNF